MRYVVFKVGTIFAKPVKAFCVAVDAAEFARIHSHYVVYDMQENEVIRRFKDLNTRYAVETFGTYAEAEVFAEHCELEAQCDQMKIQKYLKKHNNIVF